MINSVSRVAFGSSIGAMDKVTQEQMYSPGKYAQPDMGLDLPDPYHHHHEKKGSFLGFLGKLVLTAVVVGAGAIGIRKGLMNDYTVIEKLGDGAKFGARFKNNFAKYTDILYEETVGRAKTWVDNYRVKHPKTNNASSNTAANTAANNTTNNATTGAANNSGPASGKQENQS